MVHQLDPETFDNVQQPLLPLPGRAIIYTRAAASQERQKRQLRITDLVALACQTGFSAQQITVYQEQSVSGDTPLLRREAMGRLLHDITDPPPDTEPVKAIFVTSEDRLFRDGATIDVAAFIEACRTHDVLLVTPTMTYDFHKHSHIMKFRFLCEAEQQYTRQVVNRLQAGKQKKHQA